MPPVWRLLKFKCFQLRCALVPPYPFRSCLTPQIHPLPIPIQPFVYSLPKREILFRFFLQELIWILRRSVQISSDQTLVLMPLTITIYVSRNRNSTKASTLIFGIQYIFLFSLKSHFRTSSFLFNLNWIFIKFEYEIEYS